jgi:cell division protein FtsB
MDYWLRKILKSKWFLLFCIVILVLLVASFAREFSRRYYLEQQIKSLETQVEDLASKNDQFGQLINYLKTENFTEEEARLKMGLKKPGEEVVVINQPATGEGASANNSPPAELANPAKWWYYFFTANDSII